MHFETLELKNFGPFSKYKASFSPNGVNIITGPNGVGKTQLIGAIIFSLMGKTVVDIVAQGKFPSEVTLSICEGQITELISSSYDERNPKIQITRQTSQLNSTKLVLADYLRNVLQGQDSPQLLLSGSHRLDVSLSYDEISIISQLQSKNTEIINLVGNLSRSSKKGEISTSYLSEGQRNIVIFLKEFVSRQSTNSSIPLILDDFFPSFAWEERKVIGSLLDQLCQRDQVILLTNSNAELFIQSENIKSHQKLEYDPSGNISSLSYTYFPRQYTRKAKTHKLDKHQYVRGQRIQIEENRYYEFKEVKGDNPVRSISSIVDEYAVAFLNMGRKGVGRIVWGVSDDRKVVGVNLGANERDELRRLVTEKLHQIEPPVAPSGYEINTLPVLDSEKNNQNLFLVEIKIPSSQSEFLFSTGKGEVYIKTDAGKKKLSAQELQREILARHNRQ
jgi:hypothetical protein